MPSNQNENKTPGSDRASNVGNTSQLLHALHAEGALTHGRLYEEICRRNPGKDHDPSELVECSIKLSPRGLSLQRHGGTITWSPEDRGQLAEAAHRAAPNDTLSQILAPPTDTTREGPRTTETPAPLSPKLESLRHWVMRSSRFFSAIAYDFDAKLYKLYLFKHRPVHFLEDLDLVARRLELPSLSYIRSMEVPFDTPEEWKEALYFKLRLASLTPPDPAMGNSSIVARRKPVEILAPDFQPHSLFAPRLLTSVPQRNVITGGLSNLLADLPIVNDPVVKFTPPSFDTPEVAPDEVRRAWSSIDYGLNINLLDPAKIRFVEDYEEPLLAIADAMGHQSKIKKWLAQIAPFDCFVSYLGIGPDSVTLYYRSTTLHRRQPAPHFRRKPKAEHRS